MIEIKTVSNENEIVGIKDLQDQNLLRNIGDEEGAHEGFLSAEYSIGMLRSMNDESPSIIAKDGETVVGYALVTLKETGLQHPLLDHLFTTIDGIVYKDRPLKNASYVVVGQLCVAKNYRGLGLANMMYNRFRKELCERFDYCITDVAAANSRSLKAHIKSGFQVIDQLAYGGIDWNIVLWDWSE